LSLIDLRVEAMDRSKMSVHVADEAFANLNDRVSKVEVRMQ
jgi:hypothetical protein